MAPNKTAPLESFPDIEWLLDGLIAKAYHFSIALVKGQMGGVDQTLTSYNTKGYVKIKSPSDPDSIELPSSIGYKEGDSYANGEYDSQSQTRIKSPKASGQTAYFSFQYGLKPQNVGNIRTSAEASYTVRISSGGMYPNVIDMDTGMAILDHTITGR
ncbi:hypothetical protein [Paenibacillus sp. J23TS9]|uniref:hypothetical protein n=1 Tax=Paenibacillus sp. J23TS9 TaxID=2807193 RepID=UPI001BCB959D|nr:hypothetical protein [Paenibacillus sp. J23TS9]